MFVAKDSAGTEYRILIFTEFAEAVTRDGTFTKPVQITFATDDGQEVNRVKPGHYTIVDTALLLTSDDPFAR
jgi:hypothetical protein